jgi:predicted RecA/RadA family phage recombinase
MKNFVQSGDTLTLPAPYDLTSGSGAQVGALFGVAQNSALTGSECEFARRGVFNLKKTSAQVWTQGVKLYWDNTAREVTSVVSTNLLIGAAAAAAANNTATGQVLVDGAVR